MWGLTTTLRQISLRVVMSVVCPDTWSLPLVDTCLECPHVRFCPDTHLSLCHVRLQDANVCT